ncbi:ATP-binding protein [Vibrio anguillarum]|uniref:ATP-binding protein n=1 Tax=Vibrio anguillarum TaxID=55601 RepID=UPI000BB4E5A0|nr:ATP-binding protein [Vibrio anguillarum]ATC57404.1 ATP-binding protein [Vibrio anguillarum]MBF4250147.1 ATP-binding protein [Vibrio anguillarum]MBF4389652.1 ATP-binding protein [Vibrio anguillarum]MBF4404669.1 ATP-binding protein [Vibrio anguillarum]
MQNKTSALKRLSLKSRLLLAATFWLGTMILAAGIGIPTLIKNYLVNDVQGQLRLAMDEITANLEATPQGNLVLSSRLSDPRFSQPYSGLYWTASSHDQSLRSRSLWDKRLISEKHGLKSIVKGARDEKLIVIEQIIYLPDFPSPIIITIGLDEAPLQDTLNSVINQLWMILGLLFSGVLVLIGLQVSWSLRPLGKMQKELAALRKGQQASLSDEYPKEVFPLVNDLNALLFHYQELLERARNHAGNLSHALKTPISVLRNEIDHLDFAQQQKLRTPIEQLQKQIDYHLGRARMAGSMNILAVKANPSERVDAISMAFDKIYAQREITLVNELDSDLEVAVDPTDLDEMLGNLLENSYKWAASLVRVHAKNREEGWVEINIEDDGPGIAEQDLAKAVQRGVRLDETTSGSGLGLNIVSEMAHSYRGTLTLSTSTMGGLKAVLTFRSV